MDRRGTHPLDELTNPINQVSLLLLLFLDLLFRSSSILFFGKCRRRSVEVVSSSFHRCFSFGIEVGSIFSSSLHSTNSRGEDQQRDPTGFLFSPHSLRVSNRLSNRHFPLLSLTPHFTAQKICQGVGSRSLFFSFHSLDVWQTFSSLRRSRRWSSSHFCSSREEQSSVSDILRSLILFSTELTLFDGNSLFCPGWID